MQSLHRFFVLVLFNIHIQTKRKLAPDYPRCRMSEVKKTILKNENVKHFLLLGLNNQNEDKAKTEPPRSIYLGACEVNLKNRLFINI